MALMKTRNRWEQLRRKKEDGDGQEGEKKEEKWFSQKEEEEEKKREERMKMCGLESSSKNKERIIKIMNLPIYP